jgi:flavin reductase (DIM6/NTAB) family NADH-FMN oxidoreductase RutF
LRYHDGLFWEFHDISARNEPGLRSTRPWEAREDMNEIAALFRRLSVGVYVIGVTDGERRGAFTAAWVTQVSFDPLLVVVSVNPRNASYAILRAGGAFTVNVLEQGQLELARRFGTASSRDQDKLAGLPWHPGGNGAPVLDDVLAYFECDLQDRHPAGDHELVVGRVVGGRILDPDAVPMLYAETGDMDGSSALYRVPWPRGSA